MSKNKWFAEPTVLELVRYDSRKECNVLFKTTGGFFVRYVTVRTIVEQFEERNITGAIIGVIQGRTEVFGAIAIRLLPEFKVAEPFDITIHRDNGEVGRIVGAYLTQYEAASDDAGVLLCEFSAVRWEGWSMPKERAQ